jgi:hypothetical protein
LTDFKPASCHEAGHVLVGLYFRFVVERVEVSEGRFQTMCQIDASDRTDQERFVFLAGGVAGEKCELGSYDLDGYKDDQRKISERGGASIETYLPDAARIIESNKECFNKLWEQIRNRAIQKRMEMMISGGGNSFKLLTSDEIQQIWTPCSNSKK